MRLSLPYSVPDSTTADAERRREIRRVVTGTVEFIVMDCYDDLPHQGELVEMSTRGMRMRHTCLRLERNMRIQFQHARGSGVARTVWNRRNGQNVESGFEVES